MTKDYASDARLCLSAVSFLSEELQASITDKVINPLRLLDPNQYFYSPESLHLTIQNIRKIDDKRTFGTKEIESAKTACRKILPTIDSFDFELRGLIGLSTSVSICAFSDETIGKLTSLLRKELEDLGIPFWDFIVNIMLNAYPMVLLP